MPYTIEQQFSRDIDWYFKDSNNNMVHVASAGGRLPKIIEQNDELIDRIHAQVVDSPDLSINLFSSFEVEINPNLSDIVSLGIEENAREFYLESFIEMAKKGFISIDKTKLNDFEDTNYHIVAYPKNIKPNNQDPSPIIEFEFFDSLIISNKSVNLNDWGSFNLFDFFLDV